MIRRWAFGLVIATSIACGDGDVDPPADALELVTTELPAGRLGQGYDQKIAARGGEAPYVFSVKAGTLPAGLELKPATGQISGVPTAAGPFAVTIEVKDAAAGSASRAFTLYVEPDPLRITVFGLPPGFEGEIYTAPLTGQGGVPPLTWSLAGGALPGGLSVDPLGRIAGTPEDSGAFELVVQVSDSEARTSTRALELMIASRTPMITTATLARALVGAPFQAQLEADGGRPPYMWSLSTGTLPAGITLEAGGLLSGTPTQGGLFRFTVRAVDAATEQDERAYSLHVVAPVAISTNALPLVLINRPVDFQLEATGGLPPYMWFLTGALPAGLTFSPEGRLSGTTTETGQYMITIRVQDSFTGTPRSKLFTLRVSDQIVYEVTPNVAFPPVCTSTRVSYQTIEIPIADSLVIDDITVAVEVPFTDRNANEQAGALKLLLWAPDGRRSILCGNSAGVRAEAGCTLTNVGGRVGVFRTYTSNPTAPGNTPDVPLRVFHGMNAQGTWRFQAMVARPSLDAQGNCRQDGTIERVRITIRDDRRTDPYVLVTGFHRNNLIIDPWVRIRGGQTVPENELFLSATLWNVGPNGVREAGLGDDVPDARTFTWTGINLPLTSTITPDGHVIAGQCPATGRCRGSQGTITASDGQGTSVDLRLLVVPPDWNRSVREF